MNERTLNRPLDGSEVIEIIVQDLRRALERNCTLSKHLSYPAVSHQTICLIKFQTTGQLTETSARIDRNVTGPLIENLPVQETGVEVQGEEKAPNAARMEARLPIPALTTDSTGKQVETRISYKDPQFLAAAKGK